MLPAPSCVLGSDVVGPAPIQTPPAPTATVVGTAPIANVRVTRRVLGSIRDTVRSSPLSTQTAPDPAAMPPGFSPTGVCDAIRPLARSIATTEFGAAVASPAWGVAPPPISSTAAAAAARSKIAAAASSTSQRRPRSRSRTARRGGAGGRRRRLERRVVLEDRPLEPAQRRPGLEAQLARPARACRHGGPRSASAWRPERYSASISCARRRSRSGSCATAASSSAISSAWRPQRQIGLDAALQRDHPALQDAVDLHARLGRLGQLGQRRPAPHAQPGTELGGGALGVARRQRLASRTPGSARSARGRAPPARPAADSPAHGSPAARRCRSHPAPGAAERRSSAGSSRPSAAAARPTARRSAARSRRPRCDAATDARAPPAGDRRPERPAGRHRPPPAARESGSPFAPRGDATTRLTVRRPARLPRNGPPLTGA